MAVNCLLSRLLFDGWSMASFGQHCVALLQSNCEALLIDRSRTCEKNISIVKMKTKLTICRVLNDGAVIAIVLVRRSI